MPTPVLVPQLGNEITEAEVTEWLVSEGASVAQGDLLVVITTTKMAMEIDAPASGTLARIMVAEGDLVSVGATLAEIA
jgi:pyruvate/2-oxoglutarate dehydrogenase complex dihydrolipoamide acyltransferase (E2) component